MNEQPLDVKLQCYGQVGFGSGYAHGLWVLRLEGGCNRPRLALARSENSCMSCPRHAACGEAAIDQALAGGPLDEAERARPGVRARMLESLLGVNFQAGYNLAHRGQRCVVRPFFRRIQIEKSSEGGGV